MRCWRRPCQTTPALIELLQREHGFRGEVQVPEAPGEWLRGDDDFPFWFEGAKFALALQPKFDFIRAARVTTA